MIKKLVLVATSAGLDVTQFGASDWRPEYRSAFPRSAKWIEHVSVDLTEELKRLHTPVLLVWGDCDPISPVAVGKHLQDLLPNAVLHVEAGGDHDVGATHATSIAPLIMAHFEES